MQSAKKLGFAKGMFVHTGAFAGIIISDAHTTTPCCEVWGWEHEMGSCYASDLSHLTFEEFKAQAHNFDGTAYSEVSKKAIKDAQSAVAR